MIRCQPYAAVAAAHSASSPSCSAMSIARAAASIPRGICSPYVSAVEIARLEVAARLAHGAALEHGTRGVEVAERAPDVEVVGEDRVDQGVRLPESRVRLGHALVVAQLGVQRERPLEVGDLAPEVAGHRHQLGERDEQAGARTAASAPVRSSDRERPVPVRRRLLPREQLARPRAGAQRAVDRLGGIAGRPGEAVVQRQRGERSARCPRSRAPPRRACAAGAGR